MSFKFKQYQYYIIIGVVSLIALLFLPLIGSEAGLAWNIPDTLTGWTVFVVSKLIVAVINILIFHCFNMQGKENIKEDPLYIEAISILDIKLNSEEHAPKAPEVWSRQVYGRKGVAVFCTSILSTIGLTQAVLTFDYVSMFTYLFTITMGITFGILQMNAAEDYWTHEFWRYAKKIEKETDDDKDRRQRIQESRGTGSQE
jgi:hypothetical protein